MACSCMFRYFILCVFYRFLAQGCRTVVRYKEEMFFLKFILSLSWCRDITMFFPPFVFILMLWHQNVSWSLCRSCDMRIFLYLYADVVTSECFFFFYLYLDVVTSDCFFIYHLIDNVSFSDTIKIYLYLDAEISKYFHSLLLFVIFICFVQFYTPSDSWFVKMYPFFIPNLG